MIARRWRRLGLATRLVLSASAALAVLGILLVAVLVRLEISALTQAQAQRLNAALQLLTLEIALNVAADDHEGARQGLESVSRRPEVEHVVWVTARGRGFAPPPQPAMDRTSDWFARWLALPESTASRPVVVRGIDHGTVSLRLSSAATEAAIWTLVTRSALLLLAGLAVNGAILLPIVSRALRPWSPAQRERSAGSPERETLLRAIIEAAPGAVACQDMQLRYVLVNRQFSAWLGLTPEAILGRTLAEVAGEDLARQVQSHSERALAGQEARLQISHHRRDGTPLLLDIRSVPVVMDGERITGVASFCRDITARRQAEEALRISQTRSSTLAVIVEQSTDAIHARDLDGRVTYWNAAAERVLGFTAQEALGQPLRALHMRDLSDTEIDGVLQRIHAGCLTSFEAQRLTKAGQTIDVAIHAAPLHNDAGQHIGEICMHRDITATKTVERDLRRAKEAAEAASRAKSDFLANISHEIRTPLHVVLGLTDLVLDSELTREQRADLEQVRSSATALMSIINDILDFSKIEAGHLRLEEIAFAPADSIADMVKALAPRAHEKALPLLYDAQGLPPLLLGDPGRIRQIVLNLLSNAIKFTERGEVAVHVSLLPAPQECTSTATLKIEVRDSGIGIAAEKLGSVFNAFEQADASTTRRYGGTGLGLAMSAKLAQLMGGSVAVTSTLGQGTAFTVTLRCRIPAPDTRAASNPPRTLAGRRLLVVEGHRGYRDALLRLATGWGMAAVPAEDYEQAQAQLALAHRAGQPFDAVLLDVRLQGRDGIDWVQRLQQEPHRAHATLALASSGQRGDAARCLDAGIAAYLLKPVQPSELFEALLEVADPGSARGGASQALVTRHSVRQAKHGASILVIEDHETNQLLARRLLESFGHRVRLAENGQVGLDAATREAFDLILMDMQMPVMGGLEAATALRAREAGTRARVPIIALTANAMAGARETCLAAGMDDYMTKPYTSQQLRAMLERWLPDGAAAAALALAPAAPVHSTPSLDLAVLRSYVGDDEAMVEELLRSFLATSDKVALRLRNGLRERKAEAVAACGHQLRSSSRMVGALALGELCAVLEGAGKGGDWSTIEATMDAFEASLTSVSAAANAWLSRVVS
jgi:two-component system, sensor histidine kinase and response regulator